MTISKVGEIHVNDIGTIIQVTIKEDGVAVDISSASVKRMTIVNTIGTKIDNPAVFGTDGTDGILQYITISGDLPVPGEYRIQVQLTIPSWTGNSTIGKFEVLGNL